MGYNRPVQSYLLTLRVGRYRGHRRRDMNGHGSRFIYKDLHGQAHYESNHHGLASVGGGEAVSSKPPYQLETVT